MSIESKTNRGYQRKFYGKIESMIIKGELNAVPKEDVTRMMEWLREKHFASKISCNGIEGCTIMAAVIVMEMLIVFPADLYDQYVYNKLESVVPVLIRLYRKFREYVSMHDVVVMYMEYAVGYRSNSWGYLTFIDSINLAMDRSIKKKMAWVFWKRSDPKSKTPCTSYLGWPPEELMNEIIELSEQKNKLLVNK